MSEPSAKTAEFHNIDRERFRSEIMPLGRPAILRGLADAWPAVRAGRGGPAETAAYLSRFDQGRPAVTISAPPDIKGRFFYGEDMRGVNFKRQREPLRQSFDRILSLVDDPDPPAVFIQSEPIASLLPGFEAENVIDLPTERAPRIWIGNSVTVHTHNDPYENVAVAVAGRRRFTLFPPEQLPNLYVGPLDSTPNGAPVSLARLHEPDFERFPRFREALAAAEVADLEPGDALFIPYFWWHHVHSLDRFNVLVNYWWNDAPAHLGSPFESLLHAVWALRDLPEHQRETWRMMFEHYVFEKNGEAMGHIPPEHRGMLGALTPERAQEMRMTLLRFLAPRPPN